MLEMAAAANAVIAASFFAIFGMILAGLIRDWSLGINPLGVATALVFATCATGHAVHAEHYILTPEFYVGDTSLWHQAIADVLTLVAGLGYLAQRRRYGLVIRGIHPMLDYQRRLQMAEALRDIGQDIAAQTNLDKLLRRVVHHARDLLGADYAAIVTVDALGRTHRQVTGTRSDRWDEAAWNAAVFLARGSALGSVADLRQPVIVHNLLAAPVVDGSQQVIHRAEGGRSALAVPITSGDQVGGSLMVAYRSVRRLTRDEVSSASALANQATVAIENARLIESLRQADQLKDEFLSAAAHELKTPITTIKGWTELLLRTGGPRVDERKALETIHRQAERITQLGEDLLAVVRLRPGSTSLSRERFDLGALVQEGTKQEQSMEEHRQIRVSVSDLLPVEADRQLIAEVLHRLLKNAIRYSPAGSTVEVEARREDNEAVVSVTDHGIGIPLERQAHVFEPFYEPLPSGSPGYIGIVSLGLFLSKQVIEAHRGRIWFTSTPEEGSTFSFSLPRLEAGGPAR